MRSLCIGRSSPTLERNRHVGGPLSTEELPAHWPRRRRRPRARPREAARPVPCVVRLPRTSSDGTWQVLLMVTCVYNDVGIRVPFAWEVAAAGSQLAQVNRAMSVAQEACGQRPRPQTAIQLRSHDLQNGRPHDGIPELRLGSPSGSTWLRGLLTPRFDPSAKISKGPLRTVAPRPHSHGPSRRCLRS